MYKLEFHPLVNEDFANAANYFLNISNKQFERFKNSLKLGYPEISQKPENYFILEKRSKIRRCHLENHSYSIIYSLKDNNTVYVLAIKHDRQKNYWKKRKSLF